MQKDKEPISVECTVHSKDYTIEQLEKILKVKRRQVFNYAKIICELHHWEPEAIFKPAHGKFSERMLAEMRNLQAIGADEYQLSVGRENHRPVAVKMYSPQLGDGDCSSSLTAGIANLQQKAIAHSENLGDRFRAKLAEIALQNQQATQQSEILDDSELLAAENRGFEKALEIFQAEERAKEKALAQLRAMKLKGAG